MRILQVTPFFYPAWAYAGIPRVVYQLSKTLVKRGHKVEVYTTDALDRYSRVPDTTKIVDRIKVHYFKNASNFLAYNYRMPISPSIVSMVMRELHNFDIVHLHSLRTIQNVIVHHYAKKYGVPYIIQLHGVLSPRGRLKFQRVYDAFFAYGLLNDASSILLLSNFILRYMQLEEHKITIIPNGIDLDYEHLPYYGQFRSKFSIEHEHVVLFLGRIGADKGLDFLIRSFSLLSKDMDNVALVISGPDDGYEKELRNLVRRLKLKGKVIFTGLITGQDLLSAYVDANVLVNPTPTEAFGLVVFEAILCGTPVIAIKGSGCTEWLQKTGGGECVRYNDVLGLKELMLNVLKSPKGQGDLTKAKEYITENFSWDKVANRIEELYEDILLRNLRQLNTKGN